MKRLIVDIDDTICSTVGAQYAFATAHEAVIKRLREYQAQGFQIVLHSSRNMRTYEGNVGKINANTLPILLDWLHRHDVPFDEIYMGKPWCGHDGFYIDDKAIRPREFVELSHAEIHQRLADDRL